MKNQNGLKEIKKMQMKNTIGYKLVEAEARLSEGPVHDYKEWLLKNFQYLTKVDLKESKLVSEKYDAEVKQCYRNCWMPLTRGIYKYFEGYVWTRSLAVPLEHAWLVKDGSVIDPTLIIPVKGIKKRMGDQYLGVEIPTDFVLKRSFKIKKTGPFIYDYFETFSGQKIYHG